MSSVEYYITDGNKFVKQAINNQYKLVSNIAIADSWDNLKVAKAILENSIPKVWRGGFFVAKVNNGELSKCSQTEDEKRGRRDELTSANGGKREFSLSLYSFKEDADVQKLISGFDSINKMLVETENLKTELEKELSTLEFMLEDLKHYRLRKRLGTVNSYKFKELGDRIVEKRTSVKNQLEILRKINQYRDSITNPIKDICKTIDSIQNKKYIPRVLINLFENDNLNITLENILGED